MSSPEFASGAPSVQGHGFPAPTLQGYDGYASGNGWGAPPAQSAVPGLPPVGVMPTPGADAPSFDPPSFDSHAYEAPRFDAVQPTQSAGAASFPPPQAPSFDYAPPAGAPQPASHAAQPASHAAQPDYGPPPTTATMPAPTTPLPSGTAPTYAAHPATAPPTPLNPAAQPAHPAAEVAEEAQLAAAPPPAPGNAPMAPSGRALDRELHYALEAVVHYGASDLHLTVGSPPMIRLDGALRPVPNMPKLTREKLTSALHSVMTDAQRERFEEHLELDLAYTLPGKGRFRVNVYQQRDSIGAVMRLIPSEIKRLAELGLPDVISRFAGLPRGLVLVTGPTGSGKSTTLASLIDLANDTRADHIMTVEDPIEFLHKHKKSLVNQREVGADTHSFGAALKHVLRQDPDIILVGEMRDLETISIAITAAETGHLVFATLHTQSAPTTIDRIIDVFPPEQQGQIRTQLAVTLQGVVCQTLVKKAQGRGRAVATEVMVTNPAIANLIREGKTYQIPTAMQAGREAGMHTMDQHLAQLVSRGEITYEAGREKAQDVDGYERLVQAGSTNRMSGANLAAAGVGIGAQDAK